MDAFIGEIRAFGFNYAPQGWAQCNGQLMSIAQNTALFSILGTTYGGDGRATFGLPNLMATAVVGVGQLTGGQAYTWGQRGGVTTVTLNTTQIPAHSHTLSGATATSSASEVNVPTNSTMISNVLSKPTAAATNLAGHAYNAPPVSSPAMLNPQVLGVSGGSQPHDNMMPYVGTNYCICLTGIFPSRN